LELCLLTWYCGVISDPRNAELDVITPCLVRKHFLQPQSHKIVDIRGRLEVLDIRGHSVGGIPEDNYKPNSLRVFAISGGSEASIISVNQLKRC
jgi:hypothetical protein